MRFVPGKDKVAIWLASGWRKVARAGSRIRRLWTLPNVIAACAMILTGLQAWTTIYTAKIQSIPDLQFVDADDADGKSGCGEIVIGIQVGTRVLCIENSGLGPARLISMAATFDDQTFEIPSVSWRKISDRLPVEVPASITFFTDVVRTQTIPAGKALPLLRYKRTNASEQAVMQKLIESGRFNLSFCYCNFYHDCQRVSITPANQKLTDMSCESLAQRWWRVFEPKITLPSTAS